MPKWSAPECPFTIEYTPRALDDIRLAVVEAFFSLPRGGAEIGGVLLGRWDGEALTITDYAALDCEHAFGPSFTLSPRDEARLTDLLIAPLGDGLRPVGWYHSHTRSEIFLSDADQNIHRRFFPEPWQVALVLKPHTFQPTRAGFFFRETGGGIHSETSYHEFVLEPLIGKPAAFPPVAPASKAAPLPDPDSRPLRQRGPGRDELREAPKPSVPEPEQPKQPVPVPKFLDKPQSVPGRRPKVALALLASAAVVAAAFLCRDLWLPPLLDVAKASPPALGLNTLDSDGQLQIRWNRNSAAVQQASSGVLGINSGGPTAQEIPLEKAQLLSGSFTIARQTDRVDVSLALIQADGHALREVTTFMGKLPGEDPAIQAQLSNLSKQVEKMQSDLDAEMARNAKLRKTVDELSKELRDEERIRILNQIPK